METTAIPVKAGEVYEIDIRTLGVNGEGVGRHRDFTVFVPFALPGERVKCRALEVKKTFAKAELIEIITPSKNRVDPPCKMYRRCGGCQLQHLNYEGQLAAKRQQAEDALTRIGKFTDIVVEPTIGAENPWNYRNKMMFPAGFKNGKVSVGCYAAESHEVVNLEDCPIQNPLNIEAAKVVREAAEKLNIPIYDSRRHRGVLRHVVGRVGSDGMTVCVVTATKDFPHREKFVDFLVERLPNLAGIQQNIQPKRNGVIMGTETRNLWGKSVVTDIIGGMKFRVSPVSFFQVNTAQAEALYNKAAEFADLRGGETVLDLYCGTGTIGLFLAKNAGAVIGIEISKQAVEDAKRNAEINKIRNADFIAGDAAEVLPKLRHNGLRADVAVVDPPRSGCEQSLLETIAQTGPEKILYVSCNPATLARDLAFLRDKGYTVAKVQPVDMFPQTAHVETVCLLRRQ